MTFFYNLNKTLDAIRAKPETTHGQLNERDMSRAAKGYEKYGKEGMEALAKAGREGKDLDKVRDKYNKYNESIAENAGAGYSPEMQARIKTATPQQLAQMAQELAGGPAQYQSELKMLQQAKAELSGQMEEGMVDTIKSGAQAALGAIGSTLGHGSDEDMIRDLQKKAGLPVTGKVPTQQPGQQPAPGQQPMAEEGGMPMTAKQKSFAALAEPKDKITFADKIAGAKKEVDEMLGDVAAEAMRNALGGKQQVADEGNAFTGKLKSTPKGGKFKMGNKEYTDTSDVDEASTGDYSAKKARAGKDIGKPGKAFAQIAKSAGERYGSKERGEKVAGAVLNKLRHKGANEGEMDEGFPTVAGARAQMNKRKVGDVTHGAKHDTEETPTGRRVTRRVDDKGYSVGSETDDEGNAKSTEKRGRGRPKSADKAPERVTAKATKHKGGRKSMEEGADEGVDMVKLAKVIQSCKTMDQLEAARKMAQNFLRKHSSGNDGVGFAGIGKDFRRRDAAVSDIQRKKAELQGGVEEEAVSKAQRRAAGIAHAAQKGEIPKSKLKGASKEMAKMPKGELNKFASTKEKGLPNKKEKTEESGTVAGGMAPAAGGKSKASSIVGKGIYDSLNRDLEAMISESMNVSVNMSMDEQGQPHKNITVSAEGEAAEQLAQLLNLAGMQAQSMGGDEGCGCETSPCSCEELDENQPDWPTDQETTGEDDPLMQRWSGGLNGPKSTGQAVDAPPSLQPQRQGVMGENKDLGMKLYAELKSFKG